MEDIRVLLYDREGKPVGELSRKAGTLLSMSRSYEINGEHSMTVTTTTHIEVGTYALTHADGRWEEWAFDEPDELHDSGECATGTYHLVWSLQYDLQGVCGKKREPGMASPTLAANAVSAALDGTRRWKLGHTDVTTKSGAVMFQDSAWDRLTTVVKHWGGEIDARVTVSGSGVTGRYVDLLDHVGSKEANRRFEWGHDLTSIRRTPDSGPYYCRVIPLGDGETEYAEDDETTFEWKIGIEEVNGGVEYLRDTESEKAFRVSDGSGGWEYPTTIVSYSTDDEEELLALAKEDLEAHTRPKVSYEGTVSQFAAAGMDTEDIELGDEVQVVDRGFNANAPLRIQARVIRKEVDDFGRVINMTIGRLTPSIERTIANVAKTVGIEGIANNTSPYDQTKYPISTPALPVYTIETPDAGTYTAPTYDIDTPDYGTAIADLSGQVASLGGIGIGGDGWIHQIDGVTQAKGTVNFVTTREITETPTVVTSSESWGSGMLKSKSRSTFSPGGGGGFGGSSSHSGGGAF